jgi:serine/threonine protein kinase
MCIGREYACNGSLEDTLKQIKNGQTPPFWTHENISIMIMGILLGMRHLHDRDIFHGKLNPKSLLIDERLRIRISDFSKARIETRDSESTDLVSNTPAYLAPEVLKDLPSTNKVDVFGFGLILYEMFVGESVFPRDASMEEIKRLHNDNFRPDLPSVLAPHVHQMIDHCWSDDAEKRPSFADIYEVFTAAEFAFFEDVDASVVKSFLSEVGG